MRIHKNVFTVYKLYQKLARRSDMN